MNHLGKNLRYLRKKSSKTQSELASLIKKGQTTIGNWENGISEPSIDELLLLSNYFDIPVDVLLKTDLALASWMTGQRAGVSELEYIHSGDHTSLVKEDGSLSFVLHEIRKIWGEIEAMKEKKDS
jgi:transcriptional regulator with XRE-family HTH domain